LVFSMLIPELISSISDFTGNLNRYTKNLTNLLEDVSAYTGIEFGDAQTFNDYIKDKLNSIVGYIPQIYNFTSGIVRVVFDIVVGIAFSIYFLSDKKRITRQFKYLLLAYIPDDKAEKILGIVFMIDDTYSKYISGQILEAMIVGVACFVLMNLFGFREYTVLITVIIAICNLVPLFGAIFSAVISVALLMLVDPVKAMWFLVFIIVLQQIEGNFIAPRVIGKRVGLRPVWVLLSVLLGGGLFGFTGLLLAVPTGCVIYQLVSNKTYQRLKERTYNEA